MPELSVSFLREQGFRTAWKDIRAKCISFMPTAMSGRQLPSIRKMAGNASDAAGAVHNVVSLLQGVMDVTLRRDGKLPSDWQLPPLAITNCSTSYSARCCSGSTSPRCRRTCAGDCPGELDEPRKPKPGLTRIKRNLYRAACSAVAKPRTKVRAR